MSAEERKAKERAEIAARFRAMEAAEQRRQKTEYYIELALTVQPDWKWRRLVAGGRADAQLVEIGMALHAGADPSEFIGVAIGFHAQEPDEEGPNE